MADLVTLGDVKAFIADVPDTDDTMLQSLLDQIEDTLEQDCGRAARPFAAPQLGRQEVHDGTGTAILWLDYPITALTSLIIGPSTAAPDETLAVADPAVLSWTMGSARVCRVDGGVFPRLPLRVHVTYDAGADLPALAALAVTRAAALIYRQRGAEDVKSERLGAWSADYGAVAQADPVWQRAVAALRTGGFG